MAETIKFGLNADQYRTLTTCMGIARETIRSLLITERHLHTESEIADLKQKIESIDSALEKFEQQRAVLIANVVAQVGNGKFNIPIAIIRHVIDALSTASNSLTIQPEKVERQIAFNPDVKRILKTPESLTALQKYFLSLED